MSLLRQDYALPNHLIAVDSPLVNILLGRTLSVTPLRNLPANKRLKKFARIKCIAKIFIYVLKYLFASLTLDLLGELALNFSLHLSSRTQFSKIKKLSPKIKVNKHIKKSRLGTPPPPANPELTELKNY